MRATGRSGVFSQAGAVVGEHLPILLRGGAALVEGDVGQRQVVAGRSDPRRQQPVATLRLVPNLRLPDMVR